MAIFTVKISSMIKLVLPILFPSWRFFSGINVSPRFDVGFVFAEGDTPAGWVPFRPLVRSLSFMQHFKRFLHNPHWNELLFLNSCAERLFEGCTEESREFYLQEIAMRLLNAVRAGEITVPSDTCFMCFRIHAIYSEDAPASCMGKIRNEVVVQSDCYALSRQGDIA